MCAIRRILASSRAASALASRPQFLSDELHNCRREWFSMSCDADTAMTQHKAI